MNKHYESVYHDVELTNWWFASRRSFISDLLQKHGIAQSAAIIDIGCAGGVLLYELLQEGYTNLSALDYSPEAIALCRERGITQAYVMDGHAPEFAEGTFDVIIASDSLEHLKDDELALKNWYRILKPGGKAFILVPAYQALWSSHDIINHHFRRYTNGGLQAKVKAAGFRVVQSGYWNIALLLPTLIFRLFSRKPGTRPVPAGQGDIVALPAFINRLVTGWIRMENRLSRNVPMPAGVSTFVVVERNG